MNKVHLGRIAAVAVLKKLESKGWQYMESEYRKFRRLGSVGEVDLILYHPQRNEVLLVEVKFRKNIEAGMPLVSSRQLGRLRAARAAIQGGLLETALPHSRCVQVRLCLAWVRNLEPLFISFLENP